jgi:hypothetical protein
MTELSPNTEVILSSDLFDDCPYLENMSELAFAVLNAYMTGYGWLDSPTKKDCRGVAAALRAAVKQTRKRKVMKTLGMTTVKGPVYCLESDLLSIAAELEGAN